MTYIITYILLSLIVMVFFVETNKEQLNKNYLSIEKERGEEPTQSWFNFYIVTHFIKAPFLCPLIILLILGNGGKIDV